MTALEKSLDYCEKQKLNNMFKGDNNRDASDKIRGFLFQDLIAIDSLLDDNTEYVCLEFLEDVNVFCNNGVIKIIQAKYYPKSLPAMKEIMTDLYYQFLRMQLLESKLVSKPQLVIHTEKNTQIPDLNKMLTYIGSLRKKKWAKKANWSKWLSENVYIHSKKKDQKEKLFKEAAHEKSINEFLQSFDLINQEDIKAYKNKVEDKLFRKFSDRSLYDNSENEKSILMGLAVNYIQRRYTLNNPEFEQLKVGRSDFDDYIKKIMQEKSKIHMIAYVTDFVWEQYVSIIVENPDLNEDQVKLLNQIVTNTQGWIKEILTTKEGQFQLLNTISLTAYRDIEGYMELQPNQKLAKIIACSGGLQTFLFYLWKIMLNLCMIKTDFCADKDANMLKPETYIEKSIKQYICIKFEKDCVKTSVILPAIRRGQEDRDYDNISNRMYMVKPQKWYVAGNIRGKKDYQYPISVIREEGSIVDMETDSYIVECMKCIGIDKGKWKNIEQCETCIFKENCVEG